MSKQSIGTIGNYYGCLSVKTENGKYYWSIECYNGDYWEEIPEKLYQTLMEFERSRQSTDKPSL